MPPCPPPFAVLTVVLGLCVRSANSVPEGEVAASHVSHRCLVLCLKLVDCWRLTRGGGFGFSVASQAAEELSPDVFFLTFLVYPWPPSLAIFGYRSRL